MAAARNNAARRNEAIQVALDSINATFAHAKPGDAAANPVIINPSDISVLAGPKRDPDDDTPVKGRERELHKPLKLRNGHYLYLFYRNYIDRLENDWLKTSVSKMSYQLDEGGFEQVFRFDYNRFVKTPYPASHLHVYGTWDAQKSAKGELKELKDIHFPVVRPTIESVVRILINDFGIEPREDREVWEPTLDESEKRFKEIMSKQIHRENKPKGL